MDRPFILFYVQLMHPFYGTLNGKIASLVPTPATQQLMHRRGAQLEQKSYDHRWYFCCKGEMSEGDTLEWTIETHTADFVWMTQTPESPSIKVCITASLIENAAIGQYETFSYHFRPALYYWEYLFVISDSELYEHIDRVSLEEAMKRITFTPFERLTNSPYGTQVVRTLSTNVVLFDLHSPYALSLWEILPDAPTKRRIMLGHVPCPIPGRHLSDRHNTVRQVCYI
jgi:hypothetical protein